MKENNINNNDICIQHRLLAKLREFKKLRTFFVLEFNDF